ncbi:MAG: hypothetical protein HQK60_09800 [Deltaproteobacteria bacterium]|nr:hypothetical protein [Deltaproteobacteria bacterium]
MSNLVKAKNRGSFNPSLNRFLQVTKKLKELRQLAIPLPTGGTEWRPPLIQATPLVIDDNHPDSSDGRIRHTLSDATGALRGVREILPLPPRPGEAQMGLSYDWFWEEFARHLISRDAWAKITESELVVIQATEKPLTLEDEWTRFWEKLSSKENLEQTVRIFLDHKTLFKSQARPWDSTCIPIISESMAEFLIDYYQTGRGQKRHFKQGSIPGAITDIKKFIKTYKYVSIPLPMVSTGQCLKGGDFHIRVSHSRCGGCGQIIGRGAGFKRLAVFLKDSDERPQAAVTKDDITSFCARCVATVFLCRAKLPPWTLDSSEKTTRTVFSICRQMFNRN